MRRAFVREQRMPIIYGVLCIELIILILQLWLLTATMNAYLGGDESIILPRRVGEFYMFWAQLLVAQLSL